MSTDNLIDEQFCKWCQVHLTPHLHWNEMKGLRTTIYNDQNGIVPLLGSWQTEDKIHSDVLLFPLQNF